MADPGLFQFTDKVSDSLIPTDTRSRGLSRFFICNVRSGELCFGLIVREDEPGEYKLFTNLYVSGIDTGYGQRKREPIFGEKNMILSKKLRNL